MKRRKIVTFTLAPNARRWAVLQHPRTHPRCKCESVGRFAWHWTHGPTLASNTRRWVVLTQWHTNGPTLAPNTSQWAVLLDIGPMDSPLPQKRVGGPFLILVMMWHTEWAQTCVVWVSVIQLFIYVCHQPKPLRSVYSHYIYIYINFLITCMVY